MIVGSPYARNEQRYRDGCCGNLARAVVLVSMAGSEAERVILRRDRSVIGDALDRSRLQAYWSPAFPHWDHIDEPKLRHEARGLVRRYRREIEAVAEALLWHGRLDGVEIDALLAPEHPAY